jgi:hypothetical protein
LKRAESASGRVFLRNTNLVVTRPGQSVTLSAQDTMVKVVVSTIVSTPWARAKAVVATRPTRRVGNCILTIDRD